MRVHCLSLIDIQGSTRRTEEGYLDGIATLCRVGVLRFRANEIDPYTDEPNRVVNVLWPENSVFHHETMQSARMQPVTLKHPEGGLVNKYNFKALSVGNIGESVYALDDYHLAANVRITDAEAVSEIESGTQEASIGCWLDIIKQQGIFDGQPYEYSVIGPISINHLAVVESGRAGSTVRILNNNGGQELTPEEIKALFQEVITSPEYQAELAKILTANMSSSDADDDAADDKSDDDTTSDAGSDDSDTAPEINTEVVIEQLTSTATDRVIAMLDKRQADADAQAAEEARAQELADAKAQAEAAEAAKTDAEAKLADAEAQAAAATKALEDAQADASDDTSSDDDSNDDDASASADGSDTKAHDTNDVEPAQDADADNSDDAGSDDDDATDSDDATTTADKDQDAVLTMNADQIARERTELIVNTMPLISNDINPHDLTNREIVIAALGNQVSNPDDRSDEYLEGQLDFVLNARKSAEEQRVRIMNENRTGNAGSVQGSMTLERDFLKLRQRKTKSND